MKIREAWGSRGTRRGGVPHSSGTIKLRDARKVRVRNGLLAALAILSSAIPGIAADRDWATYGHDYGDSRHSPLAQITPANVGRLKLAWTYLMRTPDKAARGWAASEITPFVGGGTMYVSTPYGRVVALDAASGAERWAYE